MGVNSNKFITLELFCREKYATKNAKQMPCYKLNISVTGEVNPLPVTHTYMKHDKYATKNVKQMPCYKLKILVTGEVNQLPVTHTYMKHDKYATKNVKQMPC